MPPFGPVLNTEEIAAVVTYIRGAWGNEAPPVAPLEVMKSR
jgi:mono/diheme cytochrome c family protein